MKSINEGEAASGLTQDQPASQRLPDQSGFSRCEKLNPERVQSLDPRALRPHPLNAKIYGDEQDKVLAESIEERGVEQPLIVTEDRVIISGHRRCSAAIKAGLLTVPAIVRAYGSEEEQAAALLECNQSRIKTNVQRIREYLEYLPLEKSRAEARMKAGKANGGNPMENFPQGDVGLARDHAAERMGMCGKTAEKGAQVLEAIESLFTDGRSTEADDLLIRLNKSIDGAFRFLKNPEKNEAGRDASTNHPPGGEVPGTMLSEPASSVHALSSDETFGVRLIRHAEGLVEMLDDPQASDITAAESEALDAVLVELREKIDTWRP